MGPYTSIPARLISAAIATAFSVVGSAAATFEYLSQYRTISIVASLGIESYDTGESESAGDSDYASAPGFGVFDEAVGLSGFGLTTGYGSMSGSGRASQASELSAEFLRFEGFTDVYVAGYSGPGAVARGSGSATAYFLTDFLLTSPALVELSMSSGFLDVTGEFLFYLADVDGNIIWDQTYDLDDNGWYLTTYSKVFDLQPGTYSLQSYLGANSWFDDSFGSAGQAVARFSLTALPPAVPEAGAGLAGFVVLVGAAVLHGWRRRPVRPPR